MDGCFGAKVSEGAEEAALEMPSVSPDNKKDDEDPLGESQNDGEIAVSYEDFEGMLTNLGVISALVLSFLVGLFPAIPMEEIVLGDYFDRLRRDKRFRTAIIQKLDSQGFNFTINPPIHWLEETNIRSILEGAPKLLDDAPVGFNAVFDQSEITGKKADWSRKIDVVFHLTKGQSGVLEYSSAWSAGTSSRSNIMFRAAAPAIFFILLSLVGSVCLYSALALGNSREDKSGKALKNFNFIGLPIMFFFYVLLIMGVILFFIALINTVALRNGTYATYLVYRNIYFMGLLIPCVSIILSCFVAFLICLAYPKWRQSIKKSILGLFNGAKED